MTNQKIKNNQKVGTGMGFHGFHLQPVLRPWRDPDQASKKNVPVPQWEREVGITI
jgi:hypothetical protein